MATYRFVIVDVFTETALAGNQLAVFTNATGLTPEQMQALALEIGFSETTFVLRAEAGGDARVRIFTPHEELPFAGHPVLGTAFAVAGSLQSVVMRLETARGIVPVALERDGAKLAFGRMQQPIPTVAAWPDPAPLIAALGVEGSRLPIELYDNGVPHVYVALDSFDEVAALSPEPRALAAAAPGMGVNAFAVEGGRVKTRMFFDDPRVSEDAATGSAAGPLAVHLARHGVIAWGTEFEISQGAEIGRPSTLWSKATGTAEAIESVEVGGSAVVVGHGEFRV